VNVANVAPTVSFSLDNDTSVNEGTTHTYDYTVTDPGVDSFTVDAGYPKCGLYGTLVGTPTTTASGGSFQCSFPDGPHTTSVAIKVTDSDGASTTDSESVQVVDVANVPPTVTQYGDLAVTGTVQINPKLRLAIGNYFENYKLNAQIEDPAVLNLYASAGSGSAAPVALVTRSTNYSHYDPHVGIEFRASQDTSLRASAGSSITQPFPALVSGFGSITIPNAANGGNYTNSIPNFALKPATSIAYDAGLDQRVSAAPVPTAPRRRSISLVCHRPAHPCNRAA